MNLVAESLREFLGHRLLEFKKTGDPKKSLDLGIENSIRLWMRKNTYYNVDKRPAEYAWQKAPQVYSLLWLCVKYDRPEWVKALLNLGWDVHENDDAALRWAAGLGYPEMVDILLRAGADPNAKGPGKTRYAEPLEWAQREGYAEIVDMLNKALAGEYPGDEIEEVIEDEPEEIHREEIEEPEEEAIEEEPEDSSEEEKNWF